MDRERLKHLVGARIVSEANDLKRTVAALAKDLAFDETWLQDTLIGKNQLSDLYRVVDKMGEVYPIDKSDLYMIDDDGTNSVKIMRASESEKSSRIFKRKDRDDVLTPYYEYRDTAMSKVAPFKPEWIKQLRVVNDSDPENPDVVYNNGHFLHQMTFFIGPVNFYWEVQGEKVLS